MVIKSPPRYDGLETKLITFEYFRVVETQLYTSWKHQSHQLEFHLWNLNLLAAVGVVLM